MRRLFACVFVLVALAARVEAQTTDTRVPTSHSSVWQNFGGTDRTDSVNDPVGAPDDDTTYIWNTASGQRETFGFSPFAVPGGSTISNVTLTARCRFVGTSSAVRLNILNETPTTSEDADQNITGSYANYTRVLTQNPFTTAAWTVNQVNSEASTANRFQQFQVRSITPNTEIRCTQAYASVTYTTGGGGASTGLTVQASTLGVGQ